MIRYGLFFDNQITKLFLILLFLFFYLIFDSFNILLFLSKQLFIFALSLIENIIRLNLIFRFFFYKTILYALQIMLDLFTIFLNNLSTFKLLLVFYRKKNSALRHFFIIN